MSYSLLAAAILAPLFVGCSDAPVDGPWSTPTDPTVERPADTDDSAAETAASGDTGSTDADGDGWTVAGGDCDDSDAEMHPGATEVAYDGVDQDCDGADLTDVDGDGDDAEVVGGGDCDDASPSVHPGAAETCNAVDDDCDGSVDEGDDLDGDGSSLPCDCDDADATVNPTAVERCDNGQDDDCDGADLFCGIDGELGSADADAVISGPSEMYPSDALASGDIDADGRADLIVGSPVYSGDSSAVDVFFGPVVGSWTTDDADSWFPDDGTRSGAGMALASSDFDGDGRDDVLVGGSSDSTGADRGGAAWLVLSPSTGETELAAAEAKIVGDADDGQAGWVVASGDTDGDGLPDLLVGAPGDESGGAYAGAVAVFTMPVTGTQALSLADTTLVGEPGGEAGTSMASGDLDGDGVDDLLVGAWALDDGDTYHAGAAYVLRGPVRGTIGLADADLRLAGTEPDGHLGYRLAVGDMDGDGLEDAAISAPWAGDGTVYLLTGRSDGSWEGATLDGTVVGTSDARPGFGLTVGDIDADGAADLVTETWCGADAHLPYCYDRRIHVVQGPLVGVTDIADAKAIISNDCMAGISSGSGDLNGDGADDALVAWWSMSETYWGEGSVRVFYGGGF